MKKSIKTMALFVCLLSSLLANSQTKNIYKGYFNFYVANDLGRNGYYQQKPIAELMGTMAEESVSPEFVVAVGDVHHFLGVRSIDDPLWLTNYEQIYSHPELMLPWFPVLGNHEYRGNTQACMDYSYKSMRWQMPSRYYTKVFEAKGSTLRIVFIDTTPLISKYRLHKEFYPDAYQQDDRVQLNWLDSILDTAKEDWIIVMGHHPVYAETPKDEVERTDMQNSVGKILKKHNTVNMYINGHIHNFQHIKYQDCKTEFVTNSSASLSRKVKAIEGTVFCSSKAGFSIVSVNDKELILRMIDDKGEIIHEVKSTTKNTKK